MRPQVGQIWRAKEVDNHGAKYFEIVSMEGDFTYGYERNENWELIMPTSFSFEFLKAYYTLDTEHYKVGDVLVNDDGKKMILGISGKVYHMSEFGNSNCAVGYLTREELDERGYQLKIPRDDSKVELSMDEVAEKFGVDVKKLKIKK